MEIGNGAETADQFLVHQLGVVMRATLIPVLEGRDGGGHDADGGHQRGRCAEPVEQAARARLGGSGMAITARS